jgi:ABC-type sulfate/molybdate transport systems ATPase subunit
MESAAVLEFSLNVQRGSFHLQVEGRFAADWTVLFGPSGAGKTTLLRLLAGVDENHAGRNRDHSAARIVFDGNILTDAASGLHIASGNRKIGMVAQQPALFPHLTAAANIAYGLRRLDVAARERRVHEMLDFVGAADLALLRPDHLSGGQAQRVALARALAPAPRLLLLDEPFSALDGQASDLLLDRLKVWVREHGVQTVLATHDVSDALSAGAEVLLLREGRRVALGPAAQVLTSERTRLLERLGPEFSAPDPKSAS